jgi:hypothetical protein
MPVPTTREPGIRYELKAARPTASANFSAAPLSGHARQRKQFLRPLLAKLIAGLGGERH